MSKLHDILDVLAKNMPGQTREDEMYRAQMQQEAIQKAKEGYAAKRQQADLYQQYIQSLNKLAPGTMIPTSAAGSILGISGGAPSMQQSIFQAAAEAKRDPTIDEIEGSQRIFFDQVLADPDAKTIAMLIKDKEWQAVSVLGSNGVVGINIKGQVGKWLYATTYHSYRIKISDAIAILQMAFTTLQRTEETRGYFEAVEAANVVG